MDIYKNTMKIAGYLCGISIHAMRRALGEKTDDKSTLDSASRLSAMRPACESCNGWTERH